MFRCANCQQDINLGAAVCPFCRRNPHFPDNGVEPTYPPSSANGQYYKAKAGALAVFGAFVCPAMPWLGIPLMIIGAAGLASKDDD